MARKLSKSLKIVKQYKAYSDNNFKNRIGMMTVDMLQKTLDAFEDECEYDYIEIILDEFKQRGNA